MYIFTYIHTSIRDGNDGNLHLVFWWWAFIWGSRLCNIYFQKLKIYLIYMHFHLKSVLLVQSLSPVKLPATPWTEHARLHCPSPYPGVCSNSRPDSQLVVAFLTMQAGQWLCPSALSSSSLLGVGLLPAMQETQILSLGREDPLEKGTATQCSILAWGIPWREESSRLWSTGSQRVGHNWVTNVTLLLLYHTLSCFKSFMYTTVSIIFNIIPTGVGSFLHKSEKK